MKSLIYYPYFEVEDKDWLKFTSLYTGSLSMVIPKRARNNLSDEFLQILNDSSFIDEITEPQIFTTTVAELAINKVSNYLYSQKVIEQGLNMDYLQEEKNQNYELFREKYSSSWADFCLEKGLGHKSKNGLLLTKEISYLYMHYLTEIIADNKNKQSITDSGHIRSILADINFDKAGMVLRQNRKELFAKEIINLKLPKNISEIEMKEFIVLRNDEGFQKKLSAFHRTLENYLENSDSTSKAVYLDSLSDVEGEIVRWLPLAFNIGVSAASILIENEALSYLPDLIELTVNRGYEKSSDNDEDKKLSYQFLTDIKNMI